MKKYYQICSSADVVVNTEYTYFNSIITVVVNGNSERNFFFARIRYDDFSKTFSANTFMQLKRKINKHLYYLLPEEEVFKIFWDEKRGFQKRDKLDEYIFYSAEKREKIDFFKKYISENHDNFLIKNEYCIDAFE